MRRPVHVATVGTDELTVAQQYAKLPQHGLVVSVQQRTTRAGRGVLLTPDQVRQLRDDLSAWLSVNTAPHD